MLLRKVFFPLALTGFIHGIDVVQAVGGNETGSIVNNGGESNETAPNGPAAVIATPTHPEDLFASPWSAVETLGAYFSLSVIDDKWKLTVSFTHNDSLPACGVDGGPFDLYPIDGLPLLMFRAMPLDFPPEVTDATGFDHLSLDWNPCGHPPFANFAKPHTDVHFYYVSKEFRRVNMTCDVVGMSPECSTNQTTEQGQSFFVVDDAKSATDDVNGTWAGYSNMPPGFTPNDHAAVVHMGMHSWDQEVPPLVSDWVDPELVVGTYGGQVVFYEPMVPYDFYNGTSRSYDAGSIEYVRQTILHLPNSVAATSDENGTLTMVLTGSLVGVGDSAVTEVPSIETKDVDDAENVISDSSAASAFVGSSAVVPLLVSVAAVLFAI